MSKKAKAKEVDELKALVVDTIEVLSQVLYMCAVPKEVGGLIDKDQHFELQSKLASIQQRLKGIA